MSITNLLIIILSTIIGAHIIRYIATYSYASGFGAFETAEKWALLYVMTILAFMAGYAIGWMFEIDLGAPTIITQVILSLGILMLGITFFVVRGTPGLIVKTGPWVTRYDRQILYLPFITRYFKIDQYRDIALPLMSKDGIKFNLQFRVSYEITHWKTSVNSHIEIQSLSETYLELHKEITEYLQKVVRRINYDEINLDNIDEALKQVFAIINLPLGIKLKCINHSAILNAE